MPGHPFALYDAFTARPFGGSQAAVIGAAGGLDPDTRFRIARELGYPATAFVESCDGTTVRAQFFSPVAELPMCGHGTVCMVTWLVETEQVIVEDTATLELDLPAGPAEVHLCRRADGRVEVMLATTPPRFETPALDVAELARHLALPASALHDTQPPEVARGDFIHLVLPVRDLAAIRAIAPDFPALGACCQARGIETVAVFTTETERPEARIHVRDFCPAVGVWESAAAGTTNAALSAYLARHGLVGNPERTHTVLAEQGLEIGRPSTIRTELTLGSSGIESLLVGGVATRLVEGSFSPGA